MADVFDFPPDLVAAARRFREVDVELDGLERPRFTVDYPEGVAEREAALMEEARVLAAQVVTHEFWQTLEGPARVAARTALKRQARASAS